MKTSTNKLCEKCGSKNLKNSRTTFTVIVAGRQMNVGRVSVRECIDCYSVTVRRSRLVSYSSCDSTNRKKSIMNIIGSIANIMFYLQAYKNFISKSAQSVSGPGFLISVIGISSWLLYGISLKNKPLILAMGLG